MSSSTTLSTRHLVPGYSESISVVYVDARRCNIVQDVLNRSISTTTLGVCLRLSKRGTVDAVALAMPTTAFLITVGKNASSRKGPSSSVVDLAHVLDNPKCLLVGPNIARTALLLNRLIRAHVRGYEALSLPANLVNWHAQVTVADLAATHLRHSAQKREIHALCLRDKNADLCLRAWLLARYVPLFQQYPNDNSTCRVFIRFAASPRHAAP